MSCASSDARAAAPVHARAEPYALIACGGTHLRNVLGDRARHQSRDRQFVDCATVDYVDDRSKCCRITPTSSSA